MFRTYLLLQFGSVFHGMHNCLGQFDVERFDHLLHTVFGFHGIVPQGFYGFGHLRPWAIQNTNILSQASSEKFTVKYVLINCI